MLSQDSISKVRLIPPSLNPTQENCPRCGEPFIHHQKQKSLRHVAWTRYNACPRLRRTIRKSAVMGVIGTVTIPFILFSLTLYVNDLLANADNKKNLADTLERHNKSLSIINNCTCSISTSSESHSHCRVVWINRFYQNHLDKIKAFAAITFSFLFIFLSIIIFRYFVCVPKHQEINYNLKQHIQTQTKHQSTKTDTSVQTQTLLDDLYGEYGEFVINIE